jgi:Fic family protein
VFQPLFTITPRIAQALMRIEAAKQSVADLPMTAKIQASLRETARLRSTHYSTQIEGNKLTLEEASRVIHREKQAKKGSRDRDETEVLGYYRALDELERVSKVAKFKIQEATIKTIHALVMGGRNSKKPSPYRSGQNVIRDSQSGGIVYMPPEAKDVSKLMTDFVKWLNDTKNQDLPCPIRAAVAHYQFATIHPYYDGNGRTARLLTTLVLHIGGYGLKGFYSLEEYYARALSAYYNAIAVGPSHNYYEGRAQADITSWIEYFCIGMAESFEAVQKQAKAAAKRGAEDQNSILRSLDARQRLALGLFVDSEKISAAQVSKLLAIQPRTARDLCQKWVESGFLSVANPSKKSRTYLLASKYERLIC